MKKDPCGVYRTSSVQLKTLLIEVLEARMRWQRARSRTSDDPAEQLKIQAEANTFKQLYNDKRRAYIALVFKTDGGAGVP